PSLLLTVLINITLTHPQTHTHTHTHTLTNIQSEKLVVNCECYCVCLMGVVRDGVWNFLLILLEISLSPLILLIPLFSTQQGRALHSHGGEGTTGAHDLQTIDLLRERQR